MVRQYDEALLQKMREREMVADYKGAPLLVKKVPDSDEVGIMDPRLYKASKKEMKLMSLLPKKAFKMDTSEEGILKLRKVFDGVKSVETCSEEITRDKHTFRVDGVDIDIYQYYQKKTTKESPVLYYMHGGGFFGGSHEVVEESLKLMCEKFAFSIFSIDYRLAPENPYPIGHKDCFEGLKWIYEHAEELNINPNLIFVGGDSAGGNLAQYCSTCDYENHLNIIKGQILLYPTLNMAGIQDEYFSWNIEDYQFYKKQEKPLKKMLMLFGNMSEGMESILSVKDVNNDYLNPYTKDPKSNPPTFISVGEHDYLKVESMAYAAKLHAAGIETKTVLYNGMGHAYFDNTGVYPQCEDCIEEIGQFIKERVQKR